VEAVVSISLAFNYQIWIKGRLTRRLEKNWPNFSKIAQKVKKAKISTTKLNLKAKNINNKQLLTP
jgi:hypothetical protein